MRVLLRLTGGLGNQMFQYAAARALTLDTGGQLELDPRGLRGGQKHDLYRLGVFQVENRPCPAWRLPNDGSQAKRGLRVPKFLRRYHRYFDFGSDIDVTRIKRNRNTWLQGYFQSERYFAHHADQIRRDYTFRNPPAAETQRWLDRIGEASLPVALHVRRGDYLPQPGGSSSVAICGVEYYRKALSQISNTVGDPTAFIFSDDPDWVQDHLNLDCQREIVRGNPATEDLRLITACHHNIIANSTFSWWGAWLNPRSDKMVFAPDRWIYSQMDPMRNLVPDHWTTLPVHDPFRFGPHLPS